MGINEAISCMKSHVKTLRYQLTDAGWADMIAMGLVDSSERGRHAEYVNHEIKAYEMAIEALNEQAVKIKPKKFICPQKRDEPYRCPTCNHDLGFTDDYFGDLEITRFCRNCGQALK